MRTALEETTDATVDTVMAAIGEDLATVVERTDAWSGEIVDRGWFPPDPYKRASG